MSVICLLPATLLFPKAQQSAPSDGVPARHSGPSPLRGSVRILCAFSGGVCVGVLGGAPHWLNTGAMATGALFCLVFAVGIGFGADARAFGIVRDMRIAVLAAPALTVLGTALGALIAAALAPELSLRDSLSVGAGLGYYSLSSMLIESSGNSALASVALLANIFREMTAILAAPLLSRFCGKLSPVGAAGATAMDTCLPVIARFSGEETAVIAVFSGMTLTLLVPFLVTAALHW